MVATSTCGITCPREITKTCPNVCSVFSDFLAFIVLAAELGRGVILLVAEPLAKKPLDDWMNECDTKYGGAGCPDKGDASWYDEKFNSFDTKIAVALFVLALLQVARLVFGMLYRNQRLASTGINNSSWEYHVSAGVGGDNAPYRPMDANGNNQFRV